mmetsp:Transcript_3234/g.5023  ORF Transcript_3234/g.5023 Transcript_3234/m.5023 type:complete len:85 (+) Transcript_3234:2514-2768(+)
MHSSVLSVSHFYNSDVKILNGFDKFRFNMYNVYRDDNFEEDVEGDFEKLVLHIATFPPSQSSESLNSLSYLVCTISVTPYYVSI